VHIVAVDQVNTYDVLASDDVVFTRGAYDAFVGGTASSSDRPATMVETTAADTQPEAPAKTAKTAKTATAKTAKSTTAKSTTAKTAAVAKAGTETGDAKPELPPGAKAPLKSGGAPKGYDVKGNADSGLFHEPDGQWYDATVAELYFKTAEDAEAAGFTRAGAAAEEGDK
jgi:large subunit ribosomal protein L4